MNRITLIGCLFFSCFADAQQLILKAENFPGDEGKAVFMIYRSDDALPKVPFKTIIADIVNGKANGFASLPFGDYAIILKMRMGKLIIHLGFPASRWDTPMDGGSPCFPVCLHLRN